MIMKTFLSLLAVSSAVCAPAFAAVAPDFEREYAIFSAHSYTPAQGAPTGLITQISGDTDTHSQTVGLWLDLNATFANNTYNLFSATTGAIGNQSGFGFSLVKSDAGFSLQYQYGTDQNRLLTANIDADLLTGESTKIVLVTEKSASARTAGLSLYINDTLVSWSGTGCSASDQNTAQAYADSTAPYINTNFNGNGLSSMTIGSDGLPLSFAKIYTSALSAGDAAAMIPEPATATLGLFGLAALALRRRRKA